MAERPSHGCAKKMGAGTAVAARCARAVAATVIGFGLAVTIHPAGAAEARGTPPHPAAVVEATHCRGKGAGPGDELPDGTFAQRVIVTVPRMAIVVVDHGGRVVDAATNTGCRPGAGDDILVQRPDGTMVPAVPGAFAGVAWSGDFTRGLGPVLGGGQAAAAGR